VEVIGFTIMAMGRNWVVAVVGQMAIFFLLRNIINEPGHPQELIVFLLALMIAASLWMGRGRDRIVFAALGAFCGAILQSKINLGVFAIAACGMVLVSMIASNAVAGAAKVVVSGLALILPLALMTKHLDEPAYRQYAILSSLAIAPLLFTTVTAMIFGVRWMSLIIFGLSCFSVSVLSFLFFALKGTTLSGIVASIITPSWGKILVAWPPPLSNYSIGAACASLVLCLCIWATKFVRGLERLAFPWFIATAKMAYGLTGLYWACLRADSLSLSFLPCFAWLLVVDEAGSRMTLTDSFPRLILAWTAVMESMWAYPVAGGQVGFATVLPVALSIVCLSDGFNFLTRQGNSWQVRGTIWFASAAIVCTLVIPPSRSLWSNAKLRYSLGVANSLPGASHLRLFPAATEEYEELSLNLAAASDTFICTDGFNSLYFWTGKYPPTDIVLSHSISWLDDAQQRSLIRELAKHPRACVVVQQPFLNPDTYRYFFQCIDQDFKPWFSTAHTRVMVRKDRPLPEHLIPPSHNQAQTGWGAPGK
jgi:hypothetical protein